MSDLKTTPGPWVKCYGNSVKGVGHMVAVPFRDGTSGPIASDSEQQANAHLIAAAPELYEALAEIDKWSRRQNIALPSPAIYSALAKARGEQP